ncbi:MAG: hypothetical protein HPY55_03050 [Firmicutes bacterium]|nr:hypothetical protein [Bacillota bacterium]
MSNGYLTFLARLNSNGRTDLVIRSLNIDVSKSLFPAAHAIELGVSTKSLSVPALRLAPGPHVVTPTGISQKAASIALRSPYEDFARCVNEWQRRRDVILAEAEGMPIIPAAGGWSMLFGVGKLGYDSSSASDLVLRRGKIAATPMRNWGEQNSDQFVHFVFSNETTDRLTGIGERIERSLCR